VRKAYDIV